MSETHVRPMETRDVEGLVEVFKNAGWHKPASLFHGYLDDMSRGTRLAWVAEANRPVGYVTLNLAPADVSFRRAGVPSIDDLNVVPAAQGRGFGWALLRQAEDAAFERSPTVGLGVGLTADYAAAFSLYLRNGYRLDGRGATYRGEVVPFAASVAVDDDLNLMMVKSDPNLLSPPQDSISRA